MKLKINIKNQTVEEIYEEEIPEDIDNDEYDEDEPLDNNAEPLKEYPDLPDNCPSNFDWDPLDLVKKNFLDKYQRGY